MTTSTTAIVDTILVATSTGSMGASHTGLGVYEHGFSMRGNTLGVSMHREPFSYTHGGFQNMEVSWHLTPGTDYIHPGAICICLGTSGCHDFTLLYTYSELRWSVRQESHTWLNIHQLLLRT